MSTKATIVAGQQDSNGWATVTLHLTKEAREKLRIRIGDEWLVEPDASTNAELREQVEALKRTIEQHEKTLDTLYQDNTYLSKDRSEAKSELANLEKAVERRDERIKAMVKEIHDKHDGPPFAQTLYGIPFSYYITFLDKIAEDAAEAPIEVFERLTSLAQEAAALQARLNESRKLADVHLAAIRVARAALDL